jgi:hypothetical protein
MVVTAVVPGDHAVSSRASTTMASDALSSTYRSRILNRCYHQQPREVVEVGW